MNEIVDFGKLGKQDVVELMDEEAEVLLASPRCPSCNHLGIFHRGDRNEDGNLMVICRFGCQCG